MTDTLKTDIKRIIKNNHGEDMKVGEIAYVIDKAFSDALAKTCSIGELIDAVGLTVHPKEEPIEMKLCETRYIALRPNQLYIFTVDPDCPACVEAAKVYKGENDASV